MSELDQYASLLAQLRDHLDYDEVRAAEDCLRRIQNIIPDSQIIKDGFRCTAVMRMSWVFFSTPAYSKNESGILKLKKDFLEFTTERGRSLQYPFRDISVLKCTNDELIIRMKKKLFEHRYRTDMTEPSSWVSLIHDAMSGIFPPFEAGYCDESCEDVKKQLRKEINAVIGPEKNSAHDAVLDSLIFGGNKIEAIRYYREKTGVSLREAKDYIDQFF